MQVLIAPDKFKGSLSAGAVADSLATGLRATGVEAVTLPLADGGDGSIAAAVSAGFHRRAVDVHGATGTPHRAEIAELAGTAVVEVANTCGLQTLADPAPITASSRGFGEAIRAALDERPTRLVMTLGGSASTDGGIGMLAALGFRFADASGDTVPPLAANMRAVHRVDDRNALSLDGLGLVAASDVTNPLLGSDGAAAVFGPQKGADPTQIDALDNGLGCLVKAFARSGHPAAHRYAQAAGSGAAGGLGFAALILGAHIRSGAEYFLTLLDFDRLAGSADVIVTGEGRLDRQTLSGKLPAAVAERVGGKPVIAVAGKSELRVADTNFSDIIVLSDHSTVDTLADPDATARALVSVGSHIGRNLATGPGT